MFAGRVPITLPSSRTRGIPVSIVRTVPFGPANHSLQAYAVSIEELNSRS
jgi:hypothetical protein